MNDIQKGLCFLFLPLIAGCIALVIGSGNLPAENTREPLLNTTLNHSVNQVDAAARQALQALGAEVKKEDTTRSGKKIRATAPNQEMTLVLEPLAASATRLSIHTRSNDTSTSKDRLLEILRRTQHQLQG